MRICNARLPWLGRTVSRATALLAACALALSLAACTAATQPGGPATTALPVCTASPLQPLTTDITRYSPLMSSAFGIHIFAKDVNGNPVKGKWTATWGMFCTATQADGGWKISEPKAEWDGAADIWWQFPLEQNPNGEMPSAVTIRFEGNGYAQTLTLEKAGDLMVKVSGTPDPTPAPVNISLNAYSTPWRPGVSSASGIRIRATDEGGAPLIGDWSTPRGYFVIPPFRNADGSVSLPDQQPSREMKGLAEVEWYLGEDELAEGGVIELRFTLNGRPTVLLLNYDADMGVVTIGERFAAFSPDEVRIIKEFSALVRAGKPSGELMDYTRQNIGKLNNGLGAVLADAVLNSLMNGDPHAVIDWPAVIACFGGAEGEEIETFTGIIELEADKPSVVDGQLAIPLEELAGRYIAAREYVQTYPLRTDWHARIEEYEKQYLSSLLTLNGMLFTGDDFTVPEEQRTAYDAVIAKVSGDELGKLLESWVALLKREGWQLTNPARDFLTQHGVPGYGRLSGLTWDDLSLFGVKLGTDEAFAADALRKAVPVAQGAKIQETFADGPGGSTRTLDWSDGTKAVFHNGKLYSLESSSPAASLPNGLHAGMGLNEFKALLGEPHEAVDGAWAWGVGSNDNLIVTVKDGVITALKVSLIE